MTNPWAAAPSQNQQSSTRRPSPAALAVIPAATSAKSEMTLMFLKWTFAAVTAMVAAVAVPSVNVGINDPTPMPMTWTPATSQAALVAAVSVSACPGIRYTTSPFDAVHALTA